VTRAEESGTRNKLVPKTCTSF